MTMKRNKKGNVIFDTLLIIVVLIVFSLVSILGYKIYSDFNTDLQADEDMNEYAKNMSADMNTRFPSIFDGAFVFLFILLWVFVIISSFMIDTHPIFFVCTAIISVFIIIIAASMANAWNDVTSDEEFASLLVDFPFTVYIIQHYVMYVVILMFTAMVALFAKSRMT
jgi:hypothetical protein